MENAQLAVVCQPNAKASALVEWVQNRLKVRVAAPPQEGKANDELVRLLSQACGVPPSSIAVTHGHASRLKLLTLPLAAVATLRATIPQHE
jgi:uncharacterized protein (TIGR00251 family)